MLRLPVVNKITSSLVEPNESPPAPCPKCKEPARYIRSVSDEKREKPIRIFQCDPCNWEIWSD